MAAIVVTISNAPGDTIIKRKVEIPSHTKDYVNSSYIVPYIIKHYDNMDQPLAYIPDFIGVFNANNEIRVWVNGIQYLDYPTPGYDEMGMFDYLSILQNSLPDEAIIMAQMSILDNQGRFNTY